MPWGVRLVCFWVPGLLLFLYGKWFVGLGNYSGFWTQQIFGADYFRRQTVETLFDPSIQEVSFK